VVWTKVINGFADLARRSTISSDSVRAFIIVVLKYAPVALNALGICVGHDKAPALFGMRHDPLRLFVAITGFAVPSSDRAVMRIDPEAILRLALIPRRNRSTCGGRRFVPFAA